VSIPGRSRADVCRRRKGSSSEISLPERHPGTNHDRQRRGDQNLHKGIGTKCSEKYFDE
jgi:hypothetical protein